ncbi:fumarylacetoacetate hydrolase family protein [Amycolatopsis jejuensis]|uniref:fumarylacetoacetate hydrolase family protein n=1 Tax=Amycolatopsis jejuensis TaxID=330084 RepID=UPI000526874D|nr:fumarylacetoacetate hydrolase family protein [Amycolatopsis jejuensis]
MFIANVDHRLTTFVDGSPVDVETASGGRFGSSVQAAYERWDELRSWAAGIGAAGAPASMPAELQAPSPRPRQVFGIGLNYRDHAEEAGMKIPDFPMTFTKFASCIAGPSTPVGVSGDATDWEVELVVVIGRPAYRVTAADAWAHVAGLTIGQDLSDRERQFAGEPPQFNIGKSLPGYGPTGPWLATADEFADSGDLGIRCFLDGEKVQESRTSQLIFPVPELIEKLSADVRLLPGDLIFTGTPSGVGFARTPRRSLRPGQILLSEIEGIGQLATHLVSPEPTVSPVSA